MVKQKNADKDNSLKANKSDSKSGDAAAEKTQAADALGYGVNILRINYGAEKSVFRHNDQRTLTVEDVEAIAKECPSVSAAAPVIRVRSLVKINDRNWVPMNIYGTTPAYLAICDWQKLAAGNCFSDDDVHNAAAVCLIGQTVAKELFGDASPLNQQVQINSQTFQVCGVLDHKGKNDFQVDLDDIVLLPWTVASKLSQIAPAGAVDQVWSKADAAEKMSLATAEMTILLRERHHLGTAADDFHLSV